MSQARKPRIGVSACFFHEDPKRPIFKGKALLYVENSMLKWVLAQGAYPILIPQLEGSPVSLEEFTADLDGLILQGGSDVAPGSYGETALKPEWGGDAVRDAYEIALVREFMARKKPVLGICRGAQLLNVALGGTLIQDIGTQVPGALNHRDWEIYDQNFHEIALTPGSPLEKILGGETGRVVNTIHHQGLKDLGKGVQIDARAPDGMVEAISVPSERFVLAVQWHPEFHDHAGSRGPKNEGLLNCDGLLREFLKEATRAREERKS